MAAMKAGILLIGLLCASIAIPSQLGSAVASQPSTSQSATVYPNRTVNLAGNWVTPNVSAGGGVNSTLTFSKQNNEVVMQAIASETYPYPLTTMFCGNITCSYDSISIAGSYANGQHSGSLDAHLRGGVSSVGNLTASFSGNSSLTEFSGSVDVALGAQYSGTILENSTVFYRYFNSTFGNSTFIGILRNSTLLETFGRLNLTDVNVPPPVFTDQTAAHVGFTFDLKGDFFRGLTLLAAPNYGLSDFYNVTMPWVISASFVETYTASSQTVVLQTSFHFGADLDSRFNASKLRLLPDLGVLIENDTSKQFFNSTTVYISGLKIIVSSSMTETRESVTHLLIQPPTVNTGSRFQIPGLFAGNSTTAFNFTLAGGSAGGQTIYIIIPSGVPAPTNSNSTAATWLNLKDLTALAPIEFSLTPPTGLTFTGMLLIFVTLATTMVLTRRRSSTQPSQT